MVLCCADMFFKKRILLKNLPATPPYGTHNMFTFEVHENRYKPWLEETLLPIDICLKILNNVLPKEKEKEREWHKKALIFIRYTFNATEESMILGMSCLGPGKLATDKTIMDKINLNSNTRTPLKRS